MCFLRKKRENFCNLSELYYICETESEETIRIGENEPMKKLFRLFTMALVAVALCNCGDEGGSNGDGSHTNPTAPVEITLANVLGSWQLTSWSASTEFPNTGQTVYLQLQEGGAFTLYNVGINSAGVVSYTGTFALNGTTLSGRYSDGEDWACDYTVSALFGNMMQLTAEGTNELSTFTRVETIPEDVTEHAVAAPKAVRSEQEFRFL